MPRPTTERRVWKELEPRVLKPRAVPLDRLERVSLPLDGLEALRLADVDGLYHEEAADRMGVSRATFARVLRSARHAVADALLHGKAVVIGGGVVTRHSIDDWPCPIHDRRQRRGRGCLCDERKGATRATTGAIRV